jgi:hypothetical protein
MKNESLVAFTTLFLLLTSCASSSSIPDKFLVDDSFSQDPFDPEAVINYVTCGEEIYLNNTYFVNPNYPSVTNTGLNCLATFGNISENVCQLRLEFPSFVLAKAASGGSCNTDKFSVQGATFPVPSLCGYNTGQHMYVDIDPNNKPSFQVAMDVADKEDRLFNIKIIQIPCDAPYKAPPGCLQYVTSHLGRVQSLGFPYNPVLTFQEAETRQLSSQQYSICIRPEKGYCSITWIADPVNDPYYFFVNGQSPTLDTSYLGTLAASSYGERCRTDYLIIPGGSFINSTGFPDSAERFCGAGFPASVTSSFRPFQLYSRTDNNEIFDIGNFGFSLNFTQNLC